MTPSTPFVHLHVHSDYSPMEGVSSLTALCEAARAQGADTLALTDTNGLYGAIRFLEIAKETGLTRQTIYRIKDDPAGAEAALAAWGM